MLTMRSGAGWGVLGACLWALVLAPLASVWAAPELCSEGGVYYFGGEDRNEALQWALVTKDYFDGGARWYVKLQLAYGEETWQNNPYIDQVYIDMLDPATGEWEEMFSWMADYTAYTRTELMFDGRTEPNDERYASMETLTFRVRFVDEDSTDCPTGYTTPITMGHYTFVWGGDNYSNVANPLLSVPPSVPPGWLSSGSPDTDECLAGGAYSELRDAPPEEWLEAVMATKLCDCRWQIEVWLRPDNILLLDNPYLDFFSFRLPNPSGYGQYTRLAMHYIGSAYSTAITRQYDCGMEVLPLDHLLFFDEFDSREGFIDATTSCTAFPVQQDNFCLRDGVRYQGANDFTDTVQAECSSASETNVFGGGESCEPPSAPPTMAPTVAPTAAPTAAPTVAPTMAPTAAPTMAPTAAPTMAPTMAPTAAPTLAATAAPSTVTSTTPAPATTTPPPSFAPTTPPVATTDPPLAEQEGGGGGGGGTDGDTDGSTTDGSSGDRDGDTDGDTDGDGDSNEGTNGDADTRLEGDAEGNDVANSDTNGGGGSDWLRMEVIALVVALLVAIPCLACIYCYRPNNGRTSINGTTTAVDDPGEDTKADKAEKGPGLALDLSLLDESDESVPSSLLDVGLGAVSLPLPLGMPAAGGGAAATASQRQLGAEDSQLVQGAAKAEAAPTWGAESSVGMTLSGSNDSLCSGRSSFSSVSATPAMLTPSSSEQGHGSPQQEERKEGEEEEQREEQEDHAQPSPTQGGGGGAIASLQDGTEGEPTLPVGSTEASPPLEEGHARQDEAAMAADGVAAATARGEEGTEGEDGTRGTMTGRDGSGEGMAAEGPGGGEEDGQGVDREAPSYTVSAAASGGGPLLKGGVPVEKGDTLRKSGMAVDGGDSASVKALRLWAAKVGTVGDAAAPGGGQAVPSDTSRRLRRLSLRSRSLRMKGLSIGTREDCSPGSGCTPQYLEMEVEEKEEREQGRKKDGHAATGVGVNPGGTE